MKGIVRLFVFMFLNYNERNTNREELFCSRKLIKELMKQTISLGGTDQLDGNVATEDGSSTIDNSTNNTGGSTEDAGGSTNQTTLSSGHYFVEVQHILAHQHHSTLDLVPLIAS